MRTAGVRSMSADGHRFARVNRQVGDLQAFGTIRSSARLLITPEAWTGRAQTGNDRLRQAYQRNRRATVPDRGLTQLRQGRVRTQERPDDAGVALQHASPAGVHLLKSEKPHRTPLAARPKQQSAHHHGQKEGRGT